MIRLPPRSTRTDTLDPYTTLFRSNQVRSERQAISSRQCHEPLEPKVEIRLWDPILEGLGSLFWFVRSEEHTSELRSLMRSSYAVFCLNKKRILTGNNTTLTLTTHHNNSLTTITSHNNTRP